MDLIRKFFKELLPFKDELKEFYGVNNDQVFLHLTTFYQKWDRKICERQQLAHTIRKAPYFLDDNVSKRLHGKPVRCLLLDKTKLPYELALMFTLEQTSTGQCGCDISVIFNRGCQCDGF